MGTDSYETRIRDNLKPTMDNKGKLCMAWSVCVVQVPITYQVHILAPSLNVLL